MPRLLFLLLLAAVVVHVRVHAAQYITIMEPGKAPPGKCVVPNTKEVMESGSEKISRGTCASHRCESDKGVMQVVTSLCPIMSSPRLKQCTNPSLPYPKCCPGNACK